MTGYERRKRRLERALLPREVMTHGERRSTLYGDDVERLRLRKFINNMREKLFGKRKATLPG